MTKIRIHFMEPVFSTGVPRRINIPEINSLRCVFMLVIFFHHMNDCTMFPPGGYIAVTFFFVLSGFSLTIGYRDRIINTSFSYYNYILRRLTKFYPLHWLALIISLVIKYKWSRELFSSDFLWEKLLSNFFLLQSFIPIRGFYFSFNSPSWYLSNIVFYCILFPFLLKGILKLGKCVRLSLLFVIIFVYLLLVVLLPDEYRHAFLYISPFVRLLDFVFGIYTGLFFLSHMDRITKNKNNKVVLSYIVVICFFVLAIFSFCTIDKCIRFYTNYLYWIIFCPVILTLSLLSVIENTKELKLSVCARFLTSVGKILQWGGVYSFSFYMIHYPCIVVMDAVCEKLSMGIGATVVITLAFTMVASIVCQSYFAEPIGKYFLKINKR